MLTFTRLSNYERDLLIFYTFMKDIIGRASYSPYPYSTIEIGALSELLTSEGENRDGSGAMTFTVEKYKKGFGWGTSKPTLELAIFAKPHDYPIAESFDFTFYMRGKPKSSFTFIRTSRTNPVECKDFLDTLTDKERTILSEVLFELLLNGSGVGSYNVYNRLLNHLSDVSSNFSSVKYFELSPMEHFVVDLKTFKLTHFMDLREVMSRSDKGDITPLLDRGIISTEKDSEGQLLKHYYNVSLQDGSPRVPLFRINYKKIGGCSFTLNKDVLAELAYLKQRETNYSLVDFYNAVPTLDALLKANLELKQGKLVKISDELRESVYATFHILNGLLKVLWIYEYTYIFQFDEQVLDKVYKGIL